MRPWWRRNVKLGKAINHGEHGVHGENKENKQSQYWRYIPENMRLSGSNLLIFPVCPVFPVAKYAFQYPGTASAEEPTMNCTASSFKRRRFLLAGISLPFVFACSRSPKAAAIPRGATVLAFGDSVTFGTGAGPGEDWPTLLAAASGWRIVNAGIPGDTAEAGKSRIAGLLQEHRPALVIVEIGGNDFLRRRSQKAVKEDIRAILSAIRGVGVAALLIAAPEPSLLAAVAGRPSDAPIYAELAREEKVPVIEDVFSDILAKPEWRADPVHPNAAGYREMAERLAQAMRKLGVLAG